MTRNGATKPTHPPKVILELQREIDQLSFVTTRVIRTRDVVVAHWVRLKCQYGCVEYGRRLSCPPYSPDPDVIRNVLQEYSWAILVRFDPVETANKSVQIVDVMRDLEKRTFLRGFYKALALTSGPCLQCDQCDLTKCRFPALVRPSMEATGIDVFSTVKRAGFEIATLQNRDQQPFFFGLLLIE